ncbi:MAG: PEP-CTERM sorting domain-containing protein, partial [Thiobacillus sp.]|nr:PEP-CTERM sorting domain-containing protein [Thiobacillus sp.]
AVDLSGDRAVQFTGNNNNAAYRQFAPPFSGNQLFVDFYIQVDSGTLANNDFLALWLDTAAAGDHTARPNIGIKSDGSGLNDVFARTNGTGGSFVPNSNIGSTNDVTHHIVGLLTKSGGNYNKFEVWLDPTIGDLLLPDAAFSGNAGIA